ncbi:acyltransferase domain-containing protein [Streptomyces sp. NPDC059578]|uniref:acyltransferase domain-containing protein n=1 Tax=Streptomyces sp. NPDC059578 TaxID=3346874 RepID=UPI0036D1A564
MGAERGTTPLDEAARTDEQSARWLAALEDPGIAPVRAELPPVDDLPDVLLGLAVPHEAVAELLALRDRFDRDPSARLLLERAVAGLLHRPDEIGEGIAPQTLPTGDDPLGRCFPIFVYLAALPHTRALHRARGIEDEVSRASLADLGRQIAVHRRRHGETGTTPPGWCSLAFRGELYQLGRLQFQRAQLLEGLAPFVIEAGLASDPTDLCASLHIPDFRGPLSPDVCDRSLERARSFFARHYPEERYRTAACSSWLLDTQLRTRLRPGSNIVRFQERFRFGPPDSEPDDQSPVAFVFGDPTVPWDELPRRTSVERAIGDHLRSGGHWYHGRGWFPL